MAGLTPDDNIQHEYYEADDSAADMVAVVLACGVVGGRCFGCGEEGEE